MKTILSCSIILFCALTVSAQFKHGLKAGVNLSTIQSEKATNTSTKVGGHLGWYGQFFLGAKLSVLSGLTLSDKGFKFSATERYYFLYATLPVLVRYPITKKLSAEAGGGIGYLINSFSNNENYQEYVHSVWNNRIDFEIAAGLHYTLNDRFGLGLRYEHGLSNIVGRETMMVIRAIHVDDPLLNEQALTLREAGYKDQNRNLQISISYSFN